MIDNFVDWIKEFNLWSTDYMPRCGAKHLMYFIHPYREPMT